MNITVEPADYRNPDHGREISLLLNHYAAEPMGGGKPLPEDVQSGLATELAKLPHAFSLLARSDGRAIGLANCFELFSTFACRPLINIHDLVVHKDFRGQGIGRLMLSKIEDIARARNCCKLTLEVLEGNPIAQRVYRSFGFADYELSSSAGRALFWQKTLTDT